MKTVLQVCLSLIFGSVFLVSYSDAQDTRQARATETARFGQAQNFTETSLAKYEKNLNAILRARLPEEKEFIATIVKLVGDEKLPRGVVDTSFAWVRKRRPYTNFPFFYFERVLRLQTSKLEIEIPAFDFKIYQQRRFR